MEEAYDEIMRLISTIPEATTIRQRAVLMKQIRDQFRFYVGEANNAIEVAKWDEPEPPSLPDCDEFMQLNYKPEEVL
jgi:hypothetical protein